MSSLTQEILKSRRIIPIVYQKCIKINLSIIDLFLFYITITQHFMYQKKQDEREDQFIFFNQKTKSEITLTRPLQH